jgi:opacity protein-like surface antigen
MLKKWVRSSLLGCLVIAPRLLSAEGVATSTEATTVAPVVSTTSAVESPLAGYYVRASLGYAWTQKPKAYCSQAEDYSKVMTARDVHVGNAIPVGLGFGYVWDSNWRSDFEFTYRGDIAYRLKDDVTGAASGKLKNYTAMVNVYYDFDMDSVVTPYAGLGLGYSLNKTDKATWSLPSTANTTEGSKSVHTFAWSATLGGKYDIDSKFSVDLAYRYADLGKFRNNGAYSDGTTGASIRFNRLHSNEVVLGLTYSY